MSREVQECLLEDVISLLSGEGQRDEDFQHILKILREPEKFPKQLPLVGLDFMRCCDSFPHLLETVFEPRWLFEPGADWT